MDTLPPSDGKPVVDERETTSPLRLRFQLEPLLFERALAERSNAATELRAEHMGDLPVDGIDISEGMLKQAEAKGLYRNRILADLTKTLPIEDAIYGGFVSCGTFTHGHVGPEVFPELMRIAKPGALFVCGVIPPVYDGAGFGSRLALMVAHGLITPVQFHDIPIYEKADHAHAQDRGLVMAFRKN